MAGDEAVPPAAEPAPGAKPAYNRGAAAMATRNPTPKSAAPAVVARPSQPAASAAPPVVSKGRQRDLLSKHEGTNDKKEAISPNRQAEDKNVVEEERDVALAAVESSRIDVKDDPLTSASHLFVRMSKTNQRKSIYHFGQTKKKVELEWENSYRIGPSVIFPVFKAQRIVKFVLEYRIADIEYDPEKCLAMAKTISQEIREKLKNLWVSTCVAHVQTLVYMTYLHIHLHTHTLIRMYIVHTRRYTRTNVFNKCNLPNFI